jgi:hypothetical protein
MSEAHLPALLARLSNDLLFLCDAQGAIVQVGAVAQQRLAVKLDQRFGELLTSMSRPKGVRFWEAIRALEIGAATEPWELHFHYPGTLPLSVSVRGGKLAEDHFIVVGAAEAPQLARLYQELLGVNGELTALVRRLSKEQSLLNQQIERLLAGSRDVSGGSSGASS